MGRGFGEWSEPYPQPTRSDHPKCLAMLTRGRAVTPGGAQTMSRQASRFVEGVSPVYLVRGFGPYVECLDDHSYVDWILGLGPLTLGYSHPVIQDAVGRALKDGTTFSLPHPLEVIVAERLVRLIPCGRSDGMVRFVKTGTEAGHAAIRIARAYTGREPIIAVGYHGWSDTFMAAAPDRRGIPEVMSSLVTRVPYGDLDAMSAVLLARPHAAVMMEPVLDVIPDPSYLPGVRNLCENTETLLIFDEVVSGFRWHIGGAQAYFGVTPDLATFGKAMAGGLPLAAIVGPRPIMEIGGRYISGTFGGESLSLAAANAVLDLYEGKADGFSISYRRPVIERLWEVGELLFRLWPRHLAEAVGASLTGYSVHPVVKFRDDPDQIKMSLFLQEVLLRGVLIHPGGFNTSAVHSDENVAYTAQAFTEALLEVEIALSTSTLREALRGLPIQPGLTPRPASA